MAGGGRHICAVMGLLGSNGNVWKDNQDTASKSGSQLRTEQHGCVHPVPSLNTYYWDKDREDSPGDNRTSAFSRTSIMPTSLKPLGSRSQAVEQSWSEKDSRLSQNHTEERQPWSPPPPSFTPRSRAQVRAILVCLLALTSHSRDESVQG